MLKNMPSRDEFPRRTKELLAQKVGYRCSFPSCWIPTIGPSQEKNSSTDCTGMACHIYAAAAGKGSKRYKSDMTPEQRKSIDNGIWMCYKHGKQIDNDENRFTAELLQYWKNIAEKRAEIEHETGKSLNGNLTFLSLGLGSNKISIEPVDGSENDLVANALIDSNVHFLWGKQLTNYIKILLIELVRNAFWHGEAKNIQLIIEKNKIELIDDGTEYSINNLIKEAKPDGGFDTYSAIMEEYGNEIIVFTKRENNQNINVISFVKEIEDVEKISSPCCYSIKQPIYNERFSIDINICKSCSDIYILIPKHFALSDVNWLSGKKSSFDLPDDKSLVIVIEDTIDPILEKLRRVYPKAKIMHIQSDK